uniref:CSON014439 protein n=1 Tax=Culicoides sonorensis TaxID=179676 RepID=A0A336JY21_CULSO
MASLMKICSALMQSRSAVLATSASRQARAMCTVLKDGETMKMRHKPSDFERKLLVWAKKYKTVQEVPEYVKVETMERARNRFQIKVSNWLMIISGVFCVYLIYNGKNARDRGESITKSNLQWHKEYNEGTKRVETDYSTHFDKLAEAGLQEEKQAAQVIKH